MKKLINCKNCGFGLRVLNKVNHRHLLKLAQEHLITASLFGCEACIKDFKRIIKECKKELSHVNN